MNAAAIFARVIEAKGFSAAARSLRMPKTTVSKRVSDLEAELGTRLLNRTTRALSLTEAGARAYTHIAAALSHMAVAEREVRAITLEPSGLLTIAAPGAVGISFIVPLIIAFMERYPAVEISHWSRDSPIDLGEGRIDVMIWPGEHPQVVHEVPIARVEIGLYASPAYLARCGEPRLPADLAGHAVVAVAQSAQSRRFSWRLQRDAISLDVTPAATMRFCSNDPAAILMAVAAGQGIGGLPVRFVERPGVGADLVRVLPDWQIPPISLRALYRDGSALSMKARLFLDFIVEWFRTG